MRIKLTALIAALLAASLLVACGGDSTTTPTDTTADTTAAPVTTAPEPASIDLVADGKTEFAIIRAEEAEDETTINYLKRIRTAFENHTGVAPTLGTDWIKKDAEPNAETYEILVGLTNHPESIEAMTELKYRDYAVKLVGNKIVLAGHTDVALGKAVTHFIDKIVARGAESGKLTFSETDNYISSETYMLDTITIGGKSIVGYTITVAEDASYTAQDFARQLRDLIAARCGYYLPIAEAAADPSMAITVTDGGDAGNWSTKVTGSTLTCQANGLYAFERLYTQLDNTIRGAKDELAFAADWNKTGDLSDAKDSEILRAMTVDGDFRILYHNIWGSEMHNRDDMQAALYLTYMPDVIGLQEVNADRVRRTKNSIFTLLADTYTEVPVKATNPSANNYVPILYRADKLELVDYSWHLYNDKAGDQSKSVAWAVFRDKATGKSFGMANTHFYWTGDALGQSARIIDANEIVQVVGDAQKKHNVPFIIGGDLNCRVDSEPQRILRKADWVNANMKATVYHSDSNGHHEYPTLDPVTKIYADAPAPTGAYSAAIDHIYTYGDGVEVRVFDTLLHRFAIDSSDHCPIYVDVKIN